VLVVAHRLRTIRSVDEIVVLGKGRILERGSHEALMQFDSHYKRLYMKQSNLEVHHD
jgi:ABC-type multidrug transport system fused ATPase/permease subunit